MSTSLLMLGSFSFEGLEAPESILLKTKHRLVVHRLGSGSSSIDSLGEDTEVVSFRGIFTGTNATARSRMIEQIRSQGTPVNLTWNSKTLSVVIRDFELNYSSNQWITYKLSCYAVNSYNDGVVISTNGAFASADTQINDIVSLLQNTGISPTFDQITAINELATLDFDVAPAGALQTTQALSDSIDSQLTSVYQISPVNEGGPLEFPHAEASSLIETVLNAGQVAALMLARYRLTCISVSAEAIDQP
jgi:hypothetical protein